MRYIEYFIVITFFSLFISCAVDRDTYKDNIHKLSERDPFKETIIESDFFTVDPNKDNVIESKSGHILIIPTNGFLDMKGKVVKDSVKIEYAEATDIADFILSNLLISDSNSYYDSYSSIFINATKNGEQLKVNPDNPIYFELPADKRINLYKGAREPNGNMAWDSAISPLNNLTPIPIELLNFLPSGFELAVEKGLPFKEYKISSEELLDSLYYSFSYDDSEQENGSKDAFFVFSAIGLGSTIIAQQEDLSDMEIDTSTSFCGINPASIKAIKHRKFNHTLISTREFESRLKTIFATCDNTILELYISNLDKNLWEIDQMVADYLGTSHEHYKSFMKFASYKQTSVSLSQRRAQILSNYYRKSKLRIAKEIQKLKEELINEKKIERQKAEQKKKEYRDLLLARQKYRMNKFGFELTEFGWYNAAHKTTINQLKTFDINVTVSNGSEFNRTYSYVINPRINSVFSLLSSDKVLFNKAFSYDPLLLLWENQEFEVISVGYNGEQMGYKLADAVQEAEINVYQSLDSCSVKEFKRALRKYTRGYTKENQIIVDLEYQAFFYKEKQKREKEVRDFLFMFSLRQLVFPCCAYEWNNDEMTPENLMELFEL